MSISIENKIIATEMSQILSAANDLKMSKEVYPLSASMQNSAEKTLSFDKNSDDNINAHHLHSSREN